jgi:uroporphyrin-III C-methyltransferase
MADRMGRVILVGGGPGADDLITVRGLDRLLAADVVISDRLAPVGLLNRLGPDVEVIDAARLPGRPTLSYEQITALMIDRALSGLTVVRLKGGDPFVFAHGAQEVESCTAAGIPVEVVPGITSATAAPALAGVPLTSTEGAAGFTVVSGHLHPDDPACRLDWSALARGGTNLVILMGMRQLPAIVRRLISDGVAPGTAAACIASASLTEERIVRAALGDLPAAVKAAGLSNPATVVIERVSPRLAARPLHHIPVPREQSVAGSAGRCQPMAECVASGDAAGAVGRDGYRRARMQDGRKRLDAVDQARPGADHETVGIDRPDRDAGQLVGD